MKFNKLEKGRAFLMVVAAGHATAKLTGNAKPYLTALKLNLEHLNSNPTE
jgi:hypothetical protein